MIPKRIPRQQSGFVLVTTLAVMAALVVLVVAMAQTQNTAMKARINAIGAAKAKIVASSGIQYALATLATQSANKVTNQDPWETLGGTMTEFGSTRFTVPGGTLRIQILDASGLINLNTAPQALLQRLPLTQEQVDSLLDWREPGSAARADGGKDAYYGGLTYPYNAKLNKLDSLDELLLVRGFTASTIYSPQSQTVTSVPLVSGNQGNQPTIGGICTTDSASPNTSPTGQPKIDVSGRNFTAAQLIQRGIAPAIANLIFARRPFNRLGDLLLLPGMNASNAGPVLSNCAVTTAASVDGKVNLNTATEAVLNALPGSQPDITSALLTRQAAGFNGLADILAVPGVTPTVAAAFIDSVSVSSSTFLVRSVGTVGQTDVAVEALVSIQNGTPKIMKLLSPPFVNMPLRWGWTEVVQDTTLVDPASLGGGQ